MCWPQSNYNNVLNNKQNTQTKDHKTQKPNKLQTLVAKYKAPASVKKRTNKAQKKQQNHKQTNQNNYLNKQDIQTKTHKTQKPNKSQALVAKYKAPADKESTERTTKPKTNKS